MTKTKTDLTDDYGVDYSALKMDYKNDFDATVFQRGDAPPVEDESWKIHGVYDVRDVVVDDDYMKSLLDWSK